MYPGHSLDGSSLTPSLFMTRILLPFAALALASFPLLADDPEPYSVGFDGMTKLPEGWVVEGEAEIVDGDAFNDSRSLLLSRTEENVPKPGSVTSPAFKVTPGEWEIGVAGKANLYSPDNSFNGKVWLECLNTDQKVIERFPIADFSTNKTWEAANKAIEFPEGTTSARFQIVLNKTHGKLWIDALTAAYRSAGRSNTQTVDRILFSSAQMGNLIYPEDQRTFIASIETFRPLPENTRLTAEVRDYWGAGQAEPVDVPLELTQQKDKRTIYTARIDLSKVPLEVGRYYEIHVSVPQENAEAYRTNTSFAILPEAPTNQYKPEEIPFTSRNWDNRIEEFFPLTHRIGVRICGIWARWSAEPPNEVSLPKFELLQKYNLAGLTTTPIANIEHRLPGWEKYDDEKGLRRGTRNLLEKTKSVRPLYINLGNEPAGSPEVIKRNVAAYKTVYEEIKKTEPSIFVVGSSAGPQEEFFRQGFGEWCDAYDFHTYEDATSVRTSIAKYKELFAKYGFPKPIWSTELGLNSQGLERRVVAGELIKKFSVFFAAGGANASWFGLIYPDRDLKLTGGSEDCHNVFDCRYARYAPRLDAVAYYNMVNAIAIKKFVEEKTYPDNSYAALFRDRDNQYLQVLWRENGRKDVFVPLPGIGKVKLVRIDGRIRELDAGGKGLTLTVDFDPLILLYEGKDTALAVNLGEPAATITDYPGQGIVRGTSADVTLKWLDEGAKDTFSAAITPPLWKAESKPAGNAQLTYSLTPPEDTSAREADLLFPLSDANGVNGELSVRCTVKGQLAVRVLPEPALNNQAPGIKVLLTNNGLKPRSVKWQAELVQSLGLRQGAFGTPSAPGAKFAAENLGEASIGSKETKSLMLPMDGLDPHKLYRVRVTAREEGKPAVIVERLVGGFVGVPKANRPLALDGTLSDPAWQTSSVQTLDQGYQFAPLGKKTASWTDAGDLSARVRYLWDDQYLYVGVELTDDIAGGLKQDAMIWAQDGLQFLVDPARESAMKPGKYDYAAAISAKGPQAWCYLTADAIKAPVGEVKDIKVSAKRTDEKNGSMTYEVAIPWTRMAPFQPAAGANLGFTLIINEDDGKGRDSFMTWFGNAHTKQVDTAGDLILLK